MKIKETVLREQVVVKNTVCDFCLTKTETEGDDPFVWGGSASAYFVCYISCETAVRDPYDHTFDEVKKVEFDCCPTCWKEKVLPTLTALAKNPPNTQKTF